VARTRASGMRDRDRDTGGDQERWQALRAALDWAEASTESDDTTEEDEVDLSESEPLDVDVSGANGDTTATLDFDPASARVLTVDLADEFAGVDRERRGPVLTVENDDD
jgi:hypothetical protein